MGLADARKTKEMRELDGKGAAALNDDEYRSNDEGISW